MEQKTLKDQELKAVLQAITYKLVAYLFCFNNKCTNYRQSCYIIVKGVVH